MLVYPAMMNTTRRSAYPFILHFVREFTHGTCLVGLTHEDSLSFCSAADAEAWVRSINEKNARDLEKHGGGERYQPGSLTYRVISHRVVAS